MILEQAILYIKQGESKTFEKTFGEARKIISSMKGFIKLDLLKCVEEIDKYLLLVSWETIEDHEIGFRQSSEYQEWKRLLHHFYDPFPIVEHYKSVF
ncbi:antibiotic biosynthesis monooxygenase [Aquimarina sp. BL5]|uniref:antibiotic biosynthesis monooxygenase family protein n=1 Tax=Aquimarina sp. BL5 TaxID=1714860 RepID=UPI000E4787B2|nr:antibiotic biosynthesis monooxygenase [Aquimarina sp. BL5]AXT51722.1 antibiotic biosynthesis monooxygenase [Aquimarina sp. BL5]RKN08814.1 antibiotic biosynthesis monooxygenase [Aquimarina sp. BL5]